MNESFIFLSENGTLVSCGYNSSGQLGLGHEDNRSKFHKVPFDKKIIQISTGDYHTLVLTGLYFWQNLISFFRRFSCLCMWR